MASPATIIVDWKRGVKYIKVIALLTPLQTFQGSVPRREGEAVAGGQRNWKFFQKP